MPATSSGRIVKNRKVKSGTAHQKNHRWESFTTKISKLSSLDPIRRVRRHDIDTDDLAATTSYFKAGLEKWQELNMSEGFVKFIQDARPLCDSLPQILHFEDRIMDLLVGYIEKRERESLEPLLELMTDFAHDLGTRFEKHYAKALELLTSIAGTPQDVEVIEWSFTSLAFLFKYLSKLLVSDLRPTYDLMAPLLGKHRQQPHIARFAAEAMSFLVKKAGAPANRESALPIIVQHAKSDLKSVADTREFVLYYHGLMTLFAEAMKGNGLSVHTSGPAIFKALFLSIEGDLSTQKNSHWADVICGVLTSIIHHTSSETLKEIMEVILERSNSAIKAFTESRNKYDLARLILSARTIGVVAGVRKGSRVHDWPMLHKTLSEILQAISKNATVVANQGQDLDLWNSLVLTVSIALQYTPMDAVIPFISSFMDSLPKDPLAKWFLTFCSYLSQAEPDRFRSIILPYFRRFVVAHWSDKDNEDTLLILLPKMVSSGVLPSRYGNDGFGLPQSWQDQMVSKFERLELKPFPEQASPAIYDRSPMTWHDRCLPKYNALLEVLECTIVHPSTNARIAEILLRKLKLALRPSFALAPEEAHFIVGRGFSAYSRMIRGASEVDRALEPLLRAAAPRYARLPNFLEAMLAYEASLKVSSTSPAKTAKGSASKDTDEEVDLLGPSLVSNLSTDSHELRLLSLQLLNQLHGENGQVSEILSIMLLIEQTPLDLQSARSTSMHIRNLATKFSHQPTDSFLRQAIPSFCFGMLTVKFAQIWEDACAALKQISETKDGEEGVALLAFSWLETPSVAWDGSARNVEQARNNGLTDFECSNLMRLHDLSKASETDVVNAQSTMLMRFEDAQSLITSPPPSARAQAIRVLSTVPYIAQKRSRQFVPMFLSWASKDGDDTDQTGDSHEPVLSNWTRKDQKAQLDLLSLFTNPKVLYRSEDVYSSLLNLLANGDIEIQRSALKAILTWKNRSIKPYEENLLNLLDEARFKDEIAILLQGETLVQPEHRPDLMPVLLRLLYGRTISRKGAASGRQGMEARRLTVLRNLTVEDVGGFLDIALGELRGVTLFNAGHIQESAFEKQILTTRKQVGFTNMIEGVLKELGTKVAPFAQKLLEPVLYCLIYASRQLQGEVDGDEDDSTHTSQISLLRVVRQTGLKCLNLMFKNAVEFEWSPYLDAIIQEGVRPRLQKLPIETAQGISGILQMFLTWSASPKTVLYLGNYDQTLRIVAECLAPQKSKDEVKLFVLNIISNVVKLAGDDASPSLAMRVKTELLGVNMDQFLIQIGGVLRSQQDLSKDLLEACVQTVSELAPFVSTSTQGRNLVDVSIFLLDQPSRRVNPKTKGGLLLILEHFVPLYNLQDDAELKDRVYNTITSLFGFFKDKASREVLSRVLFVYSQNDPVISEVAELCLDLNSFAEGRLDEPDYDRRLKAFNVMNTRREIPFTARQWAPLLYNMLYYIRHDEEFGILSSNSSDGICRFIDTARTNPSEEVAFTNMISAILIPALYSGAREPSEVIRREFVKVMAHLVRSFPDWSDVNDMHGLLAGDDELESSFFNNILAAGKGRQSNALGQLSAVAEKGELSGKHVSHFFIPLIEHFIFDRAEGNDAHNLAAEATTAVGILSGSLEWPQYRAMLRRFIGYVQLKPELGKQIIRLLGRVVDALALAAYDQPSSNMTVPKKRKLAATMPNQLKLADDLTSNILPPLTTYLHDKDESTVSLRVPVAVISVRLLKLLPEEQLMALLPAVLTDICQILRSKAQESRDMARDTLTKICVLLGPSCFGFVLKELKSALARGSQRHVLSYTMHSILVSVTPEYSPGDLDYCLKPIVDVIIDDIFGDPGKEKDAEEYVSKMKEVKSNKSHDSMELIARTATLGNLTVLLHPIQLLLNEKLNLRMLRKIDELLHRISSGLLKNTDAQNRDSLQFCYEVIRDAQNSAKPDSKVKEDKRTKKYLVQRGAKTSGDRGSMTLYKYKLVGFAFDVMRAVLKRYENLRTSKNLAHFIPIIGDSVVEGEEEVKVAAFRLLTVIVKVSLKPEVDRTNLYRVAMTEATTSILASSSTTSDISQAALKLMSAVLRDAGDAERPPIPHQDKSIDKVLNNLKEDMTEPERRTPIFTFLRAIMDRNIETAGVYDTLEYAREVMVTNDDDETRNLARGAYCQFLREYIQRKELIRLWKKQRDFIKDNLAYEREDGRLSILGVILFLLSKSESPKSESSHDFVQDVGETFFRPLVSVLVGDESDKCKTMAGEVLKEIFHKAKPAQLNTFFTFLRSCIENENLDIKRIGLQTYHLYYEGRKETNEGDTSLLQACILEILEDSESTWPLVSCALKVMEVLCHKLPESMLSSDTTRLWTAIRPRLADREDPHRWIRKSAATLSSMYFADFIRNNVDFQLPLQGSGGLELSADHTTELTRRMTGMFKIPDLDVDLANIIVNNLLFLGRVAGANTLKWRPAQQTDAESEDEDEEVEERTMLNYLFSRISYILRREISPPRAPGLIPKTAALGLLQNLTQTLPRTSLVSSLQTILLPLHNLTDASIPAPYSIDPDFKEAYEALKTTATEIMESLQKQLGTEEYTRCFLEVRRGVKERREKRSSKRKIEAVAAPEKYGRDKKKKVERKKERRKERGQEHRDARHAF